MNKLLELLQALKAEGKLSEEQFKDAEKHLNGVKAKFDEKDAEITKLGLTIAENEKAKTNEIARKIAGELFDEDKLEAGLKLSNLNDAKDEDSIRTALKATLEGNKFLKTIGDPNFIPKTETETKQAQPKVETPVVTELK